MLSESSPVLNCGKDPAGMELLEMVLAKKGNKYNFKIDSCQNHLNVTNTERKSEREQLLLKTLVAT